MICPAGVISLSILLFAPAGTVSVGAEASAARYASTAEAAVQAPRDTQVSSSAHSQELHIGQLTLPADTSARFEVRELRISGNKLISTDELLGTMPLVYNASDKPLRQAEPGDLYDFRVLRQVVENPGPPREVSRRTMQGLTQYILSAYQQRGYAGIYVYISARAVEGGVQLQEGILPIEIVEGVVSEIAVSTYDLERNKKDKGFLRHSAVRSWSPVRVGDVVKKNRLDEFASLLNQNPDRYVSAVISRGAEPNTLALGYDIYESSPWHFYVQVDNAGAEERQWAPRVGLVNTSLLGFDDQATALYQGPWESGIEENYLVFGSYDFPLLTPWLRLNLYAGRSEFDTSSGVGVGFLGRGSFYGGILRYNLLQFDGWFLDITGSLSREKSRVTPTLGSTSDVTIDLWGIGVGLHRSGDISSTAVAFNRTASTGGSSRAAFDNARPGAEPDFTIYNFSASQSLYLNPNKVHRLSSSVRLINTDEKLVPSKMTTFGGLYSVRGYEEDEIVADDGLLVSAQYEFDLVAHFRALQAEQPNSDRSETTQLKLEKVAPLAFVDYGRAKIKDPAPSEKGTQKLCSLGLGLIFEVGDSFRGAIYYGWPTRPTAETDEDEGRFSFSFLMRF